MVQRARTPALSHSAARLCADVIGDFGAVEPHRPGLMEIVKVDVMQYWKKEANWVAARIASIKARFLRNG
jgi:hypothetical protein